MRKKRKKKSLLVWKHLTIIAVLVSMTLFYLWQRTELLRVSYLLREMMQQQAELREEESALFLESSRLRSPDRIEKIALRELELVRSREPVREINRP
ncbi:MAG: Cell division protein FtsL [Syntrophomonadaceae bacterium]|nr:Cell division protein FtsL [Bacillota bacterium]